MTSLLYHLIMQRTCIWFAQGTRKKTTTQTMLHWRQTVWKQNTAIDVLQMQRSRKTRDTIISRVAKYQACSTQSVSGNSEWFRAAHITITAAEVGYRPICTIAEIPAARCPIENHSVSGRVLLRFCLISLLIAINLKIRTNFFTHSRKSYAISGFCCVYTQRILNIVSLEFQVQRF